VRLRFAANTAANPPVAVLLPNFQSETRENKEKKRKEKEKKKWIFARLFSLCDGTTEEREWPTSKAF
jgi:hypothetical protein